MRKFWKLCGGCMNAAIERATEIAVTRLSVALACRGNGNGQAPPPS